MKVLIAISSKQYSGPTLDVGMNIARTLKASTTIVDVGEKISEFSLKDVDMVNELMESWEIDRPGVDVLAWAYDYLKKNKFDIFIRGSDYKKEKFSIKTIIFARTKGISSSKIRKLIKNREY